MGWTKIIAMFMGIGAMGVCMAFLLTILGFFLNYSPPSWFSGLFAVLYFMVLFSKFDNMLKDEK